MVDVALALTLQTRFAWKSAVTGVVSPGPDAAMATPPEMVPAAAAIASHPLERMLPPCPEAAGMGSNAADRRRFGRVRLSGMNDYAVVSADDVDDAYEGTSVPGEFRRLSDALGA